MRTLRNDLHDPELRMLAEQLDRLEDRLGGGTGPAIEAPRIAAIELTRVVRSLASRIDRLVVRTASGS